MRHVHGLRRGLCRLSWVRAFSAETWCFIARTRLGLEPLLLAELEALHEGGRAGPGRSEGTRLRRRSRSVEDQARSKSGVDEVEVGLDVEVPRFEKWTESASRPRFEAIKSSKIENEPLKLPEGREDEGFVEIHGPWQSLYWILRCSLLRSLWIRVTSFPCESLADLETAVRATRWEEYLDLRDLGPITAFERQSRLDASDVQLALQSTLHELRSLSGETTSETTTRGGRSRSSVPLRGVLHRNVCSLELACVFDRPRSPPQGMVPRRDVGVSVGESWSLRPPKVPSSAQSEGTRRRKPDLESTFVAALVAQIPEKALYSQLVIWDPFCRNGQILLEFLKTRILKLPRSVEQQPCARLRHYRPEEANAILQTTTRSSVPSGHDLTLVGSDRSRVAILEAQERLKQFEGLGLHLSAVADEDGRERREKRERERAETSKTRLTKGRAVRARPQGAEGMSLQVEKLSPSTEAQEFSRVPCQVFFNVADYTEIAAYLSGTIILTRVPSETHGLGCTPRMARLYRQFGHFLAARGLPGTVLEAFVLVDSRVFRRQTRLAWQTVASWRAPSQRRWWLLHWSHGQPHGHRPSEGELRRGRHRWEQAPRRRQLRRRRLGHET